MQDFGSRVQSVGCSGLVRSNHYVAWDAAPFSGFRFRASRFGVHTAKG